jgi:hypothetical protein
MAEQLRAPIDRLTVIAIGVVCGLAMLVTHEVLGHSVVTVLLGQSVVHVTNVDSSYSGIASPLVMRLIAAAGISANIVFGIVALSVARALPQRARTLSYFVWLYGHATLFMGSAYLAGFAFLPFGDVHAATAGLPFAFVIRAVLLVGGVAIYWFTMGDAARTLTLWSGGDPAVAGELTTMPYLAMGITNTVAALFNPLGPLNGALWAAAATFGANAGLLAAANNVDRHPVTARVLRIARSPAWIVCGGLATAILFFVLGPGVPR